MMSPLVPPQTSEVKVGDTVFLKSLSYKCFIPTKVTHVHSDGRVSTKAKDKVKRTRLMAASLLTLPIGYTEDDFGSSDSYSTFMSDEDVNE